MKVEQLLEARSNPNKNIKISPQEELNQFYQENSSNIRNFFISYRSINKVGVNPINLHRTPIGIYAYPMEFMRERLTRDIYDVEWGAQRKYAIIMEYIGSENRILRNIESYSNSRWEEDSLKILGLAQKDSTNQKYSIILPDLESIKQKAKKTAFVNLPFFWIWNLMRLLTNQYSFNNISKSGIYRTVQWNKYIRHIGYDAIVDPGLGLLHPNEPISSLFLIGNIVRHVKTIILSSKDHNYETI